MKTLSALLFTVLLSCTHTYAADTVRVCTYYALNYSQDNEDNRAAQFKAVVEEIKPDILVMQDIADAESATHFFTTALDPQVWSLSVFNDGPGTDQMLYFKFDKLAFLEAVYHPTKHRNIAEYRLLVKSTNDTLVVFSVHFTSGDSEEDATARSGEATALQMRLLELFPHSNRDIVVCGNFNFYAASEMGYTRLTSWDSSILFDPVTVWERDTEEWASVYTQSTRWTADGNCGGGVGGGLDDRFDLILFAPSMVQRYIPNSYTAYGNDSTPRLNAPINEPANTKLSAELAAAVRCASDHLPVYADFVFDTPTGIHDNTASLLGVSVYPAPVVEHGIVSIVSPVSQQLSVVITDITGRVCANFSIAAEAGQQTFALPVLSAGVYWCRVLSTAGATHTAFIVAP